MPVYARIMTAKAPFGVTAAMLLLATMSSCGGGGGGGGAPGGGGGGGGPVLVETSEVGTVYDAQVALGADGNGLAVWIQSDGAPGSTIGSVWANRYTAGAGWGTAVLIETGTGNAHSPRVAIDGSGNGLVVWDQSVSLIQRIWANRFTAATGTWGTAVQIETGTGGAISPQLGFDAAGNALAVWSGSPSTGFNRYTAGSGWGTAAAIQTGTVSINNPHVAVAANGNAVAVWVQFVGLRGDVWANRYTATSPTTGSWGTAAQIESENVNAAITPRVALDAGGNALAVWVQTDGTRYNVWSNRFTGASAAWGTAALIETDNVGDASAPRIAFDGSGNALAVWQQDGDASAVTSYDVWANRYTAGSGWGTAALLETGALRAGGVELAVNAAGAAVAAWYQLDGSHQSVYSRRYAAGSGWGAVTLAETFDGGNAYLPAVAINDSGAVLLVWEQSDPVGGVRNDLWADAY
jgi:hypothetical protein